MIQCKIMTLNVKQLVIVKAVMTNTTIGMGGETYEPIINRKQIAQVITKLRP